MRNILAKGLNAANAAIDVNGLTMDATSIVAASCIAKSTGASTGTLKFQASNDSPSACTTDSTGKLQPVTWLDISGQTVTITAGATFIIPKFDCCYQWIRVVYLKNNGSAGTITASINAKAF